MSNLHITIGTVEFPTPVFVASGTFGYGEEASAIADVSKLGAIVTKSISPEPRAGNPPPRLFETTAGLLNSIGLQNVGVEAFVKDKLPFLRSTGVPIIVNVVGKISEDFVRVVERLEEENGIAGYELNLSCPNVKEGGLEFSQNARVAAELTAAVRKRTGRLLMPKLTPNVTSVGEIASTVENAGADAVSLINTLTGMAVDIETWRPRINTIIGGYSGPAIKPVALAKVYQAAAAVKIPIVGIGGISGWQDAVEFFLVGAHAVQVGTANFINPRVAIEIAEGLGAYLERNGLSRPSELIGKMRKG
jgi:dihydroorotate dehydrogenase (NAD+) catalytic subunit